MTKYCDIGPNIGQKTLRQNGFKLAFLFAWLEMHFDTLHEMPEIPTSYFITPWAGVAAGSMRNRFIFNPAESGSCHWRHFFRGILMWGAYFVFRSNFFDLPIV